MKKLLYILCLPALTLVGCLKDKTINTDGLNKTAAMIEVIDGGITNFGDAAVLSPTTITDSFMVNLASTNTLASDLTITVGLNDAARTAYNSGGYGLTYQQLPDSCYTIKSKTGVIKAGQRLVTFYVTFYPAKIDPTINYMAAIGVLDAQGQTISGNLGSVYYHFIGNAIAGSYNVTGTRYNYTGTVNWNNVLPVPAGYTGTTDMSLYSPRTASPDNTTTIEIPFGNVGSGYNYVITYNATAKTIAVAYSAAMAAYSNFVTTVVSFTPPATGVKTAFHIITHYNNAAAGAGNDRIFDETFVHQ